MKLISSRSLTLAFAFVSAFAARAQDASPTPTPTPSSVQVHGKLWPQLSYDATSNSAKTLGFDLRRAFLQAEYRYNDNWSATLLLDGVRQATGTTTYLMNYVRNAYIQHESLFGDSSCRERFGLQPTLHPSYVESATGTRWLAKSLLDESGTTVTQSAGLGAWKEGAVLRYGVLVHNGQEGFNSTGNGDSALATEALVGVTPMNSGAGKLGVSIYGRWQGKGKNAALADTILENWNVAPALTWNSHLIDTAIEVSWQKFREHDALLGYGLTANVKFADERASVFARFYSGNQAFKTGAGTLVSPGLRNKTYLMTFGPTWQFIKGKVMSGLTYEIAKSHDETRASTQTVGWLWAANF